MRKIFWDTNLFIYLIEGTGTQTEQTVELLSRMSERNDRLLTSTMTLGEILTGPMRGGDSSLTHAYESLIRRRTSVVAFDVDCSRLYAQIRRDLTIKPPDAIQLASAANANSDLFITNDERLSRKQIDGISFIVSLDRVWI